MESLQLPQDLYWDVKMEPDSPIGELHSIINNDDSWLFEDNFAKVLDLPKKVEINFSNTSSPLSECELLYEFELDEFEAKPEQWIDGKPNFHQMMDYSENLIPPQSCPIQAIKVQNPLEIIMELEKIYDVNELTQLTPPQTPPQESNEAKEIFDIIAQQNSCSLTTNSANVNNINNGCTSFNDNIENNITTAMSPANSDYSSDVPNSPMPTDIARELQIVDEILRTRAKELPDWTDNDDDGYEDDDGESMHSSSSSISSTESSLKYSSLSNDDSSVSLLKKNSRKIANEKSQKKKTRPYGRPLEDKKIRKKEQNKNAATRYRQKKKQEMEVVLEEERILLNRNEDLAKQVSEIEREVKYLKQLIREFHKTKTASK